MHSKCISVKCKANFCMVTRGMDIRCFAIYLTLQRIKLFAKKWILNLGNKNLDLRTFSYSKQKWWLKSILNQTVSKKTCRPVDILLEHLYEITYFYSRHLYNYYVNNITVFMHMYKCSNKC